MESKTNDQAVPRLSMKNHHRIAHRFYASMWGANEVPGILHDSKVGMAAVQPEDAWVEAELSDDWRIAYRLFAQDGQPVIGEVRIFLKENDIARPPGEWSALVLGSKATVPRGGITARMLHNEIKLGQA